MQYNVSDLPTYMQSRVAIDLETGCWEYLGTRDRDGYGRAYVAEQKKTVSAHRLAYSTLKGDLLYGLTLDHICRNHACCNPAHLDQVTSRENIIRGVGKSARGAASEKCWRCGSDYTLREDGTRYCVPCYRRKAEERRANRTIKQTA